MNGKCKYTLWNFLNGDQSLSSLISVAIQYGGSIQAIAEELEVPWATVLGWSKGTQPLIKTELIAQSLIHTFINPGELALSGRPCTVSNEAVHHANRTGFFGFYLGGHEVVAAIYTSLEFNELIMVSPEYVDFDNGV